MGFQAALGWKCVGSECPPYLAERAFCEKEPVCRRAGIYAYACFSEGSLKPCGQQMPILLPTVCFQAGTQPCGELFRAVFVQIAQAYRRICAAGVGEQVVHAVSAVKRAVEQA